MFVTRNVNPTDIFVIKGDTHFSQTVEMRKTSAFGEEKGSGDYFTIYKPLLNLPKCAVCHGSDHTVRGTIKITSNITPVLRKQRINTYISVGFFILLVFVLTMILSRFFQGKIIRPVKQIGSACTSVTNGDFNVKADIPNRDEIGVLAETVNTMIQGLYERFELSKFVSSSTIQSIKRREKGAKDSITLFFSDIRSITAYSEKHSPEEVVEYLNKVLSFQTEIIHRHRGDVDKYVGDEIVAVFSGNKKEINACRSALDIQKEMAANSLLLYDGLYVGIGINTGEVILGMIGSESRADFTVIGDHVNYASRLCDAAKPGQVIISESVYRVLNSSFTVSQPYKIKVKGKEQFQRVYILKGYKGEN